MTKLHTIHSLEHPIKTNFLDRVYAFVDAEDIDALISEYVLEGEHSDGVSFWDNFKNSTEAIEDFERFVGFVEARSEGYYEF